MKVVFFWPAGNNLHRKLTGDVIGRDGDRLQVQTSKDGVLRVHSLTAKAI